MDQQVPQILPLSRINFSLLMIRMVTALVFFMHGYQKLFDDGFATTRDNFDAMGVPLPAVTSVLVIILELVGGVLLFGGVYTRFVGMLFTIQMIGAFFIVHLEYGFFVANGGFELVLLLATVSFALVIAGGGQYSTDTAFRLPYSEDWKTLVTNRRG